MGEDRLMYEIKKYSRKYETELNRTGMSQEEIKKTINKWVKETYKNSLKNIESSIKAYSFYNSMETNNQKTLCR